jgi:hypothetical protein
MEQFLLVIIHFPNVNHLPKKDGGNFGSNMKTKKPLICQMKLASYAKKKRTLI